MVAAKSASVVYGRVEPIFQGETVVVIGTGPSLTQEDVAFCQGRARVLAIKHAVDADTGRWWHHNGERMQSFRGLRYTLDPAVAQWATVLRNTGFIGLETDPVGLRTGKCSGYQAINLAVHLGAKRIVLLGYDLQPDAKGRDHFFGKHAKGNRPNLAEFLPLFRHLVQPLKDLGIQSWNASRVSALACFQRGTIQEALA